MSRQQVRAAYIELQSSIRPNLSLQLGGGRGGITPISFHGAARHFLNCSRRQAHGRDWASREDACTAVGFIERNALDALHMHLSVRVNDAELLAALQAGAPSWKSIRHAGDFYAGLIHSPAEHGRYVTKEFWRSDAADNVFAYGSPGDRRGARRTVNYMR